MKLIHKLLPRNGCRNVLGDGSTVEWCCDRRGKATGSRSRWDERPSRLLAGMVARCSLAPPVRCEHRVGRVYPICAASKLLGHGRRQRRAHLRVALPRLPLVGALIASNRPENLIGWICLAVGIIWMIMLMSSSYGVYGLLARPGSVPFPATMGSLGEWMWAPAIGLFGIYLILMFPDGRLPSKRWRPLAWLSGVAIVLVSAGSALSPGPMDGLPGIRNPFGVEKYPWIADATLGVTLLLPLCILASATSLVLRFVRSGGEEREQIKWLAFAASILGLGFSSYVVPGNILPDDAEGVDRLWENLLEDAVTLSFAGVPVAVGVANLRYRLYEIDLIINRTLVYGALTATLVRVYVGSILVLQGLVRAITGQVVSACDRRLDLGRCRSL